MALLDPVPTLTMLPIRFKKLHFELLTDYLNFFLSMIVNFELTLTKKKNQVPFATGGIRVMTVEICSGISVLKMPRFLLSAVLVLPCPTIKCPLLRIFVILNTHCSRYWEYKKKSPNRNALKFTGYLSSCGTLFLHHVAISQFRR